MTFIVAIDGPAGTGKSSSAKAAAKALNFIYVDTGAIYRALAYLSLKYKVDPKNKQALVLLIPHMSIVIDEESLCSVIKVDGQKLDAELRTMEISKLASMISQHQEVRDALLILQRGLASSIKTGAIFEGRDIGTVVFPWASLKIFITASPKTRAERRYQELICQGQKVDFADVLKAILKRDENDQNRMVSPMQKASDAICIDTSNLTKEMVIKKTIELINKRLYDNN